MSLCCICDGTLWNQALKITKWGYFKDSKWSQHKIETFRGAREIFGPLNDTSDSEGHFWAKNSINRFKVFDFFYVFNIIKLALLSVQHAYMVCPTWSRAFQGSFSLRGIHHWKIKNKNTVKNEQDYGTVCVVEQKDHHFLAAVGFGSTSTLVNPPANIQKASNFYTERKTTKRMCKEAAVNAMWAEIGNAVTVQYNDKKEARPFYINFFPC